MLRTGRGWWGAVSLFREGALRPFGADDAVLATRLAPALTSAVRQRPLRRLPPSPRLPPSGVVLLDPNDTIVSMSEEARNWLQALCAGGSDEMTVDDMMRVVYEVAHATRTRARTDQSLCRIRVSSGAWVALQGNRVDAGSADVAVGRNDVIRCSRSDGVGRQVYLFDDDIDSDGLLFAFHRLSVLLRGSALRCRDNPWQKNANNGEAGHYNCDTKNGLAPHGLIS